jgi:hypothetical protein
MPLALSRGDRSLLLGAGLIAVLLFGVAWLLSPPNRTERPTTYSAGSGGTKAAFLLLERAGYRVERWERPPSDLTESSAATLIAAEPDALTPDERDALLRFVEAGGRLVVTGAIGARLVGASGRPDAVAGLTWTSATATAVTPVTAAAPSMTIAPAVRLDSAGDALPLYAAGDAPVVLRLHRGSGEIYWWAAPTPLTNAGIAAPGNLEFVLASVGPAAERRVLFEEYFHGHRESLAQTLMQTPLKWMLLQAAALAVIAIATWSRRSGPVVAAVASTRLSPLEFVRTLGALYRRAGAGPVAVEVAYARFRTELTRRLGIPTSLEAGAAAALAADRRPVDRAGLQATMHACETARRAARLPDASALQLVQALHDHAVALGLNPTAKESH